jgi:hypothetical protein
MMGNSQSSDEPPRMRTKTRRSKRYSSKTTTSFQLYGLGSTTESEVQTNKVVAVLPPHKITEAPSSVVLAPAPNKVVEAVRDDSQPGASRFSSRGHHEASPLRYTERVFVPRSNSSGSDSPSLARSMELPEVESEPDVPLRHSSTGMTLGFQGAAPPAMYYVAPLGPGPYFTTKTTPDATVYITDVEYCREKFSTEQRAVRRTQSTAVPAKTVDLTREAVEAQLAKAVIEAQKTKHKLRQADKIQESVRVALKDFLPCAMRAEKGCPRQPRPMSDVELLSFEVAFIRVLIESGLVQHGVDLVKIDEALSVMCALDLYRIGKRLESQAPSRFAAFGRFHCFAQCVADRLAEQGVTVV